MSNLLKYTTNLKYMNKKIFTLLAFMAFSAALVAQPSCRQYMNAGDEAYSAGNFAAAMSHYKNALDLDDGNSELLYKYGSAAFSANAFDTSNNALTNLVETMENTDYPDAVFKLAKSRSMLGNYADADKYYDMYLSEYSGSDASMAEMVRVSKEAGAWAASQPSENEELEVTRLGGEVNSMWSDHAPYIVGDDLYFSSLRYGNPGCESCAMDSRVLVYNGKNSKEAKGAGSFNADNMLTSNSSFTSDGTGVYYSICDYVDANKIRCDLYYSAVTDGVVGEGTRLGINMDGHTTTHPAVCSDGTLYFASDRPGGKGGMDIWSASINSDGSVSSPNNVSDINTGGDDMTPFCHDYSGDMYFSSDGRVGFGGLDVYSLSSTGDITNLGAEINTGSNDLYYVLSEDGVDAYLASNRPGSNFIDENNQTCCYDIYHAVYDRCEIELMNLVYDKTTGEPLEGATVTIVDNSTGDVIYENMNPENNEFPTGLSCENSYTVTACKPGYTCDTQTVGPIEGKSGIQKISLDLNLIPAVMNVCPCDDANGGPLSGATVTVYDSTNGAALEAAGENGECRSYQVMQNTDYKITVRKGQATNTKTVNTGDLNSFNMNQQVCVNVIESCSRHIPVRLYFDNDHPNPRSTSESSDLTYSDTYNSYITKRDEFIRKYSGLFGNKGRDLAESDVARFFDNDVRGGYDSFQALLSCLTEILQGGSTANLFLRGYASPLSRDKYNAALGKRRVDVVRNEIERYRGGILKPYLANGQLKITERSFGEETSPSGVSDSAGDRRNSVYSPEASRERRVEIDEIRFDN